ncbi:MerR family transcriptional regulator [Bradyrhizobium erythrophlei]|uniref:DNA-binding transcriptional regulator, MerR family n=1 Tax=Bradyrhizobium erythrophlei TaxID=1437360 RepID=A0A1H5FSI2_9BRAD|nr:MerR family transcriptional regulator [Bradyrhizobium erythrophlei]SEE06416.1 DNA-binding transcriptional regulator, MerR family [Bradyrhizobium erythrophlei]
MTQRTYSIGEAARLSGISVRKLRFYSDQGLLPPAGRTASGYRVFTDDELVRLDLIRCLRDAGLGLDAISEVLSKELSLVEALKLRLETLEAEIAAQRRVASALRAALRSPQLTEADLRRFLSMTQLSRAERRNVVERFFEKVSDGINIDRKWVRQMIETTVPELPDDPTPEQCDAWIELSAILNDPGFIANMRSNASDVWDRDAFDPEAHRIASEAILREATLAIDSGLEPTSEVGNTLARQWLATSARLMAQQPDLNFRNWLRTKYAQHDPRATRYWELIAIMRGQSPDSSPNRQWAWIVDAMRHHLAD